MSAPKTNFSFIEQRLLCELDCELAAFPRVRLGKRSGFAYRFWRTLVRTRQVGPPSAACQWGWERSGSPQLGGGLKPAIHTVYGARAVEPILDPIKSIPVA